MKCHLYIEQYSILTLNINRYPSFLFFTIMVAPAFLGHFCFELVEVKGVYKVCVHMMLFGSHILSRALVGMISWDALFLCSVFLFILCLLLYFGPSEQGYSSKIRCAALRLFLAVTVIFQGALPPFLTTLSRTLYSILVHVVVAALVLLLWIYRADAVIVAGTLIAKLWRPARGVWAFLGHDESILDNDPLFHDQQHGAAIEFCDAWCATHGGHGGSGSSHFTNFTARSGERGAETSADVASGGDGATADHAGREATSPKRSAPRSERDWGLRSRRTSAHGKSDGGGSRRGQGDRGGWSQGRTRRSMRPIGRGSSTHDFAESRPFSSSSYSSNASAWTYATSTVSRTAEVVVPVVPDDQDRST